jgi:hypothetical protein
MAAFVLHLGHQDRLALERRRTRDPVAFRQHADDLGVRVLRDLADQRFPIRIGHRVLRLDLDVGVDPRWNARSAADISAAVCTDLTPVSTSCAYMAPPRGMPLRRNDTLYL